MKNIFENQQRASSWLTTAQLQSYWCHDDDVWAKEMGGKFITLGLLSLFHKISNILFSFNESFIQTFERIWRVFCPAAKSTQLITIVLLGLVVHLNTLSRQVVALSLYIKVSPTNKSQLMKTFSTQIPFMGIMLCKLAKAKESNV